MNGAGSAPTRSALRQSLESLLGDLVRESHGQTGYTLGAIAYGDAVEVSLEKDAARFVIWLRPSSDPTASYKQTVFFKIGYLDAPPDRAGYALLDAVYARLQRWEGTLNDIDATNLFERRTIDSPNLEMLAVRAGIKPACRYVMPADAVESLVREVRAEGLHACVMDGTALVKRFCTGFKAGETTVVHVARTAHAAARAADLERAMIGGWRRWLGTSSIERAFGQAMGYPSCCTEAFLKVRSLPNDTIRFHALARTIGTASALLNDVDDAQSIISHFVCRYDCEPSSRYAAALLAELGRVNAVARNLRTAALRGLVVRLRDGGAMRFELTAPAVDACFRFCRVEAFGSHPQLEAWRAAVDGADGLAIDDGVVRFLHGEREHSRQPAPPDAVQIRVFA